LPAFLLFVLFNLFCNRIIIGLFDRFQSITAPCALSSLLWKRSKESNDDAVAEQIEEHKEKKGRHSEQGPVRSGDQNAEPHAEEPEQTTLKQRDQKRP